jgi:anthranilate phosphoribosyltransferase
VSRFKDDQVDSFSLAPEDFGLWRTSIEQIRGGGKDENAGITLSILSGEKGPKRDIVLMNASLALVVAEQSNDFRTAFGVAADSIDSGRALKKLEEVKRVSNSL